MRAGRITCTYESIEDKNSESREESFYWLAMWQVQLYFSNKWRRAILSNVHNLDINIISASLLLLLLLLCTLYRINR